MNSYLNQSIRDILISIERVFVDDVDITGEQGGKAYENAGISSEGAVVVVRPDGYVGVVTSLSDINSIFDYFKYWRKTV